MFILEIKMTRNDLTFYFKKLEKEDHIKSKVSKMKAFNDNLENLLNRTWSSSTENQQAQKLALSKHW